MKKSFIAFLSSVLLLSFLSISASKSGESVKDKNSFAIEESCWHEKNPPSWAPDWNIKNDAGEYCFYIYEITVAPDKYEDFIGTRLFYPVGGNSCGNMWQKQCKESILLALNNEEFKFITINSQQVLCTLINFNTEPYSHPKIYTFEEEKQAIFDILSTDYAGYSDMTKIGFSKKVWKTAKSYDDITNILNKYINDTHFSITSSNYSFHKSQRFDEGTKPSKDPDKTFKTVETSNTYYIRYNSCDISWDDYLKLPSLAEFAKNKENIVVDFRSNHGGGNQQQVVFLENLINADYKGTIYVLQDNWSYSSGEFWMVTSYVPPVLNLKLVGTHSGGMQMYGNCEEFEKNGVKIWTPTTNFRMNLPKNYLGEGLGYEPDIWATTETMKSTLEGFGLDLKGIQFN